MDRTKSKSASTDEENSTKSNNNISDQKKRNVDVARWGIASTAKVNRHLLSAAPSSKVAKIVAVASRSQEKAEQYAKENNIPHAFGSYEAMFNSDLIDCVYVSVPNELHKSVTLAALRAKKHVLCEKPMTMTKKDAEEMFRAATENGVLLAEAVMTLHSGVVNKAKEIVHSGKIGKLLSMRGNWMIFGGPSSSGGALWGLGSYLTNMARFISNEEPTHVSCHCVKNWKGEGEPFKLNDDAAVVALAKFPTFVLTFEASSGGPLSSCFEILGDKGMITFESPFKPSPGASSLFLRIEKNPPEEIIVSDTELHSGEVQHLYQIELDEMSRKIFHPAVISRQKTFETSQQQQQEQQQKGSSSVEKSNNNNNDDDDDDDHDNMRQQEHEDRLSHLQQLNLKSNNKEDFLAATDFLLSSPSEIVGQHLLPTFSICGAAVLEKMQESMENGGALLAVGDLPIPRVNEKKK